MEKICKNCKHWSRLKSSDPWPYDFEVESDLGKCLFLGSNSLTEKDSVQSAEYEILDGMIGGQNMMFHQNFGCIHFKEKEN